MKKAVLILFILSIIILVFSQGNNNIKGKVIKSPFLYEYDSMTQKLYPIRNLPIAWFDIYNMEYFDEKKEGNTTWLLPREKFTPITDDFFKLNIEATIPAYINYIKLFYFNNLAPNHDTTTIYRSIDSTFLEERLKYVEFQKPAYTFLNLNIGDTSEYYFKQFLVYYYNFGNEKDSVNKTYYYTQIVKYYNKISYPNNKVFSTLLFENINNEFDSALQNADTLLTKLKISLFDFPYKYNELKSDMSYYYGNYSNSIFYSLSNLYEIQKNSQLFNNSYLKLKQIEYYSNLLSTYETYAFENYSFWNKSVSISNGILDLAKKHSNQLTSYSLLRQTELLVKYSYGPNNFTENEFLQKSAIILKNNFNDNLFHQSYLYNTIGNYFFYQQDYKWALCYHLAALDTYLKYNLKLNKTNHLTIIDNLVRDYAQLEWFTMSSKFNSILKRITQNTINSNYYDLLTQFNYANELLQSKDTNSSIEIVNSILKDLDSNNYNLYIYDSIDLKKKCFNTLEQIYAGKLEFNGAYYFRNLKDNLYQKEYTQEFSDLIKTEQEFDKQNVVSEQEKIILNKDLLIKFKEKEKELALIKKNESDKLADIKAREATAQKKYNELLKYKNDELEDKNSYIQNLNDSLEKINNFITNQKYTINTQKLLIERKFTGYKYFSILILTSILIISFFMSLFLFRKYRVWDREKEIIVKQSNIKHQSLSTELNKTQNELIRKNFNPHFIKNLLNDLSSAIMFAESKSKLIDYTEDITQLVKDVMELSKYPEILLSDELNVLNNYLKLSTKYKSPIINVEKHIILDNLDEIKIPSLITLNIIENTIKHAFPKSIASERRKVLIQVDKVQDRCRLIIKDFGSGYDTEMVNNGIKITRDKIKLYNDLYRSDFQMTVNSIKNEGTEVVFTFK